MTVFKRIFLASLFLVSTVLLAIWFYPAIQISVYRFNASIQGSVGARHTDTAAMALDVALSLLCTSGLFYGVGRLPRR